LGNFFYGSVVRIHQMKAAAIEAMQVIATLGGIATRSYGPDAQGRYGLSLLSSRHLPCVNGLERSLITIPVAWCPQLRSGAWVARREGHVFITGNSHPVDALGYGVGVLYPPEDWVRRPPKPSRQEREPAGWLGR
jgi:hypothetical protein